MFLKSVFQKEANQADQLSKLMANSTSSKGDKITGKAETPIKPKTNGLESSIEPSRKINTTQGPREKKRHEDKSSVKSQIGYRVDIVSNSYDDILFYEKKAL